MKIVKLWDKYPASVTAIHLLNFSKRGWKTFKQGFYPISPYIITYGWRLIHSPKSSSSIEFRKEVWCLRTVKKKKITGINAIKWFKNWIQSTKFKENVYTKSGRNLVRPNTWHCKWQGTIGSLRLQPLWLSTGLYTELRKEMLALENDYERMLLKNCSIIWQEYNLSFKYPLRNACLKRLQFRFSYL